MSEDWTRHTWTCDECGATATAEVKGDTSETRFIHTESGHELVMPKPLQHFGGLVVE